MKTQTTITEINQEDLVNLISAATFESGWLICYADKENRFAITVEPGDCREDIYAKILLAGRSVFFVDTNAEGEIYGQRCEAERQIDSDVAYRVTLDNIKEGLATAADGTFEHSLTDELQQASAAFAALRNDSSDFNNTAAETLMQIILFNEIIY